MGNDKSQHFFHNFNELPYNIIILEYGIMYRLIILITIRNNFALRVSMVCNVEPL